MGLSSGLRPTTTVKCALIALMSCPRVESMLLERGMANNSWGHIISKVLNLKMAGQLSEKVVERFRKSHNFWNFIQCLNHLLPNKLLYSTFD